MDISLLSLNVYLAVIPSIILLIFVYYNDVVEKEPMRLLVTMFFLGILITIPVLYIEQTIISTTGISAINYFDSFILAFLIVALVEEGYKYIILLLSSWRNKNFNQKYDAIVYAVFISLGFATIENILYVVQNNYITAIYRGIISVPAHAFYAVASGFFLGLAKENAILNRNKKKYLYLFLSFIIPILLHGIFDFLLLTENDILFGICFSFVAALYMVSYIAIKKVNKEKVFKKNKR